MQTDPVVNRLRRPKDRGPRRSRPAVLLLLCLLVSALLLAAPPRAAGAQTRPQQNTEQPQQAAGLPPSAAQPPLPDTDQTKINQPQPTVAAATAAAPTAIALTPIRDDQGLMAVAVPPTWNQVAQGEWRIAGAPAGRLLSASPNQGDFATNWGTPGISLFYSTSLPAAMEPEDLLAVFDYSSTCQDAGRGTLPPAQRSVTYQIWQNCAGTGTAAVVLVIAPAARDFYAVVEVYMAGGEDLRALGPMLRTIAFGPASAAAGAGVAAGSAPTATLAAPTPAPTATPAPVLATVITDRLNLRSGPSTDLTRLNVVTRGMQLTVTGQVGSCAWLRVATPDGQQGWVSGDPQFTTLEAPCATIPVVDNP